MLDLLVLPLRVPSFRVQRPRTLCPRNHSNTPKLVDLAIRYSCEITHPKIENLIIPHPLQKVEAWSKGCGDRIYGTIGFGGPEPKASTPANPETRRLRRQREGS